MKSFIIAILLFFNFSVFSQTDESDFNFIQEKENKTETKSVLKPKVNISTGVGVSSFGNKSSVVNTYMSGGVLIPLNEKWSIETGLMYNQGNFNNFTPFVFYGDDNTMLNGSLSSVSYYIKGNYKVNDKLTISGATYQSKVIRTDRMPKANENAFDFGSNGYSIGFNYKLGNGGELNFQMDLNNGNNPFYPGTVRHNRFGLGF